MTIIAIGAYPPPLTGQSKNLALITADLKNKRRSRVISKNIAAGRVKRGVMYFATKSYRVVVAISSIPLHCMNKTKELYVVSDGGLGLLYTILIVSIGRLFSYRIVLQHRTFAYIQKRSRLAAIVNIIIGHNGKHVFLSQGMAIRYGEQYEPRRQFLVNHNFAQFSDFWAECRRIPRSRSKSDALSVGFLSNLLPEKGVDTFIDVARLANKAALPLEFVIAGPAPSKSEEILINSAVKEMGATLRWVGQVFGEDKVRFYRSLDIFVFPTRYRFEAQPNVVLEAFCAGCYVIANDQGCIAEDILAMGGSLVPKEEASSAKAMLERIMALADDRGSLTGLRAKSLCRARTRYRDSKRQYEAFLDCFGE